MTEAAGVGAELARAREALGLSVAQAARQLKYAPRQIEALEAEAWERLPEGTFARGMLRAYARLLKLDADALVSRAAIRVATSAHTDASGPSRRAIPISDGASRANLAYGALSVALLALVAYLALEWRAERERAARPVFVPAAHMAAEPGRVEIAAAAPVPEAAPAMPPLGEAAGTQEASAGKRLVLSFEREAWVEVRDRAGRVLLSHLHPARSERAVEGEAPFRLVIGNARHVRLFYNGEPVDLAPHIKVEVARLSLP